MDTLLLTCIGGAAGWLGTWHLARMALPASPLFANRRMKTINRYVARFLLLALTAMTLFLIVTGQSWISFGLMTVGGAAAVWMEETE